MKKREIMQYLNYLYKTEMGNDYTSGTYWAHHKSGQNPAPAPKKVKNHFSLNQSVISIIFPKSQFGST